VIVFEDGSTVQSGSGVAVDAGVGYSRGQATPAFPPADWRLDYQDLRMTPMNSSGEAEALPFRKVLKRLAGSEQDRQSVERSEPKGHAGLVATVGAEAEVTSRFDRHHFRKRRPEDDLLWVQDLPETSSLLVSD